LLKNLRISSAQVIEPFARAELAKPARHGQTVLLRLDQTDVGDRLLEQILAWLLAGARVRLSADRCYPSAGLFAWFTIHGWSDRRRLKGNVLADTGQDDEPTTGALAVCIQIG
jgi:hypothetical protein